MHFKPLKLATIISLALLAHGCGFQSYLPKPIKPAEVLARQEAKTPDSNDFKDYLAAQNYPQSQLPIKAWGLNELSYSALFFHPNLNVARAQWRAAQSAQITTAERPELGINASADNHKQHKNKSPWTYTLGIDVPIVTAGKREAKISQAAGLTEAARIEIAQAAWQVRSRLAKDWLEYQIAISQTNILTEEVALRNQITDMLQKRVDAGLASNVDLRNARILLQKAEQNLNSETGLTKALNASLAGDAGLPLSIFNQLQLNLDELNTEPNIKLDDLQYEALLNRLDIRASLARYEAAEAKLRLEIAKQYPDFTLSPSKVLDQGDQIWALGFSSMLTLINKNRGMIAEASSLREVEIAQFEALQAKVIADLNQSKAAYQAALENDAKMKVVLVSQLKRSEQTQHQFDAGFADRLELNASKLEYLMAEQGSLNTSFKIQQAKLALEDAVQRPLDGFNMPSNLESTQP